MPISGIPNSLARLLLGANSPGPAVLCGMSGNPAKSCPAGSHRDMNSAHTCRLSNSYDILGQLKWLGFGKGWPLGYLNLGKPCHGAGKNVLRDSLARGCPPEGKSGKPFSRTAVRSMSSMCAPLSWGRCSMRTLEGTVERLRLSKALPKSCMSGGDQPSGCRGDCEFSLGLASPPAKATLGSEKLAGLQPPLSLSSSPLMKQKVGPCRNAVHASGAAPLASP